MAEMSAEATTPNDIRPVVRTGGNSNLGVWAFAAILLLGGLWLFSALSASRLDKAAPRANVPANLNAGRIASPPAIAMPDRFLAPASPGERKALVPLRPVAVPQPSQARSQPAQIATPPPLPARQIEAMPATMPPPATIFDRELPSRSAREPEASDSTERVRAGRLANPSHTVPLGTVIPAVLETAIDSTQAGGVRALVQRDVHSFDGSHILIPRGTRLYGEYGSGIQRGQNRAMIRWTRLLRPDGVTVALDSPASDPLGRAGVRGKVDGKFFQRFGSAILQSVLDIGVGVATREATDGVVVALPGSTQNMTGIQPQDIQPTLKVKHATSVSVYVARDLDFSSVDP